MPTESFAGRFVTPGGVRYRVYEGSRVIEVSDDRASSRETYIMRASDAVSFISESMPPPVVFNSQVIVPPRRKMPGATALVTQKLTARSMSGERVWDPFGVDLQNVDDYDDMCKIDIVYETSQYSGTDNGGVDPDPSDPTTFMEHSFDFGGEFLVIPPTKASAVEGDEQDLVDPDNPPDGQTGDPSRLGLDLDADDEVRDPQMKLTKIIPSINHSFRWPLALRPNFAAILSCLGKVNDRRSSLMFGAEAWTILFMGLTGKRKYLWRQTSAGGEFGVTPYDLTFKFNCKRGEQRNEVGNKTHVIGWNHVYRPEKGRFEVVFLGDGNRTLYTPTNLDIMLTTSG
jgi:hypothetical protein